MNFTEDQLLQKLQEQIEFGDNLIKQLQTIENIDGVLKLQRKVRQEIHFLKKLQTKNKVKFEQLCCSNLRHLGAMVKCALRPGVIAVSRNFHLSEENKLLIDLISDEGRVWTKVIARNPKSLSALSHGKASYGARSILDQAKDYLDGAQLYPCMYKPPKVIFEFVSGIEEALAKKLKKLGITVEGDILPNFQTEYNCDDSCDSDSSVENISIDSLEPVSTCVIDYNTAYSDNIDKLAINTLNLDVTAMMAYVSNMTNGHYNFIFKQPVLTQQANWESERPVKPILEKLFYGKELVCCQTAWDDFDKIMNTLGGPMEKKRSDDLKTRLTVLSDDTGGEDDYPKSNLKVRGHVRLRSKIIFNFGHRIKALTVSANEGFVRAAQQQGVRYASFIHESRALTESKEETATKTEMS